MDHEIFELTNEQQKAFNRLKKAYKDCEKLGVLFTNRYGSLYAYDKSLICSFGDSTVYAPQAVSEVNVIDTIHSGNSIKIPNEWCDDDNEHYYGLTKKGHNLYFEEE